MIALGGEPSVMRDYVAARGFPAAVSLDEDIHIFHFESDGDWRANEAALLLVNRNGHNFRLILDAGGEWHFVKTWGKDDPYVTVDWQRPGLKRADPLELIRLCGVGPQSDKIPFESLTLIPRNCTTGGRKAVWRGTMGNVRFDRDAGTFTLLDIVPTMRSPTFKGAPWESREAADWCRQNVAPTWVAPAAPPSAEQAYIAAAELAVLEESALWGAF